MSKQLQATIDAAWEAREGVNSATKGEVRDAVEAAIAGLDDGTYRTAEKIGDEWVVNQWLKKAVLLSFRLYDSVPMDGGASFPGLGAAPWFDKVPLKTTGWDAARFAKANYRSVPGSIVRRGSYIAPSVVLMPSFVNLGAYVDEGTMVDAWATVGSCAQIGANVHLSGGVGIGGVLEPVGARPVIVEDGAFIGSRSIIVEGTVIEAGAVIGANTTITGSTPIIDVTGSEPIEIRGRVPANSVVIPGTRPKEFPAGTYNVQCALIIGSRSASTDSKTSLNDALRTFEVQV